MKHNIQITAILITMFIITQLIGLFVINFYSTPENKLPYGMEPPEELKQQSTTSGLISILISFTIAVVLFFVLTRLNAVTFLRIWFFVVTTIAIGLIFNIIFSKLAFASLIALIFALPLAYFKVFKRDLLIHNLTELIIYPGIAAILVSVLFSIFGSSTSLGIIFLLLAISLYDIWAVWQSKFMQKMAKYQINKLKFFTGFFVPYAGKKQRIKIKAIKQKYKTKKALEKHFKKAKIKVNLAILGGGDIIFPIITAGIFYKIYASIWPALIISLSATLGLLTLFILARKGKFYPAMPFITIAMYLGMLVNWVVF